MGGEDVSAGAVDGATRGGLDRGAGLKGGAGTFWNKSVGVAFFLPLLFNRQLTDGGEGEERHGGSSHPVWPWGAFVPHIKMAGTRLCSHLKLLFYRRGHFSLL